MGSPPPSPASGELKHQLARRHITMISIGGVIGAGLFVGSGRVIGRGGPGALLAYLVAGIVVILIIRMLAEMATANPALGSFSQYARDAYGDWAGYTVGWLYAYQWFTIVPIEAIACAEISQHWFPDLPLWTLSLLFISVLTSVNLLSTKTFGELETWLSCIKVGAIVLFIALGALTLAGLGLKAPHTTDVLSGGELMPTGFSAIIATIPIMVLAYYGSEVATLAAAESKEPEQSIARAANSVVFRVLFFYVVSLAIVVLFVPWNDAEAIKTPFASALAAFGIPGAETAMNIIIVCAILSVLNSAIYAASRMMFALAHRGDAPRIVLKTNRRGVPWVAVLIVVSPALFAIVGAAIAPDTILYFLLNSSGAIALMVYLAIGLSHFKLRRRMDREEPNKVRMKMPGFPYLSYFAIGAIGASIIALGIIEASRSQFLASAGTLALVLLTFVVRERRRRQLEPGFESTDEMAEISAATSQDEVASILD